MVSTVILGGGLSGLAAAYELGQQRISSVQLLEQNAELGGMDRTYVHDGLRFDPGVHSLTLSPNDPTHAFLLQLIGEGDSVAITRAYSLPGSAEPIRDIKAALSQLTLRQRSRAWKFHGMQRLKDRLFESEMMTARDAWIAQFGKGPYDLVVGPYYTKLWGGNGCEGILADRLVNPLQVRKYFNPLVDAFDFGTMNGNSGGSGAASNYLSCSVGRIVERLISQIDPAFVELSTNSTVQSVEWADGRVVSVTVEQNGESRRLSADQFISGLPITELVKMFVPKPPASIREAAQALQFRARILVTLFLKDPKITSNEWVYAVDPALPYLRYSAASYVNAADGVTPITFELSCAKDDSVWNTPDSEIVERVWAPNQARFQTRRAADLVGFEVQRYCHGLPVHSIDYEENLLHVRQFLRNLRNLQLAGASSNFVIGSVPYSVYSGLTAARTLMQSGVAEGMPVYAHS